jgi:hypothetical protein
VTPAAAGAAELLDEDDGGRIRLSANARSSGTDGFR